MKIFENQTTDGTSIDFPAPGNYFAGGGDVFVLISGILDGAKLKPIVRTKEDSSFVPMRGVEFFNTDSTIIKLPQNSQLRIELENAGAATSVTVVVTE